MPNYPCCLANMHQGWPKFVEHMWMATHDQGLAAITYGPCQVTAKVANGVEVNLMEDTEYPFHGSIQFTLQLSRSTSCPLYFRIPGWAEGAALSVQGELIATEPGTFAKIDRKWESGDTIRLIFPMKLRTEKRFNHSVSILRGPLYFSLRIGKKYKKIKLKERRFTSIDYLGSADWEINNTTPWNYGLLIDRGDMENSATVQLNKISKFPFSDIGEFVYVSNELGYQKWQEEAPVVLEVKGKSVKEWTLKNNSSDDPPVSPVKSHEKLETLKLVPYACARLRVTEFPTIEY